MRGIICCRRSRDERLKRSVQAVAEKMMDLSCTIVVRAGDDDRLYGSVGTHDIAGAIVKQGFDVSHKQIILDEPIKKLGVYTIPIRLHREVEVAVKVWVVKD
jgi:large subunit ribosomal protein L9